MKNNIIILSISIAAVVLFQNCSKVAFNKNAANPTLNVQCVGANCPLSTPTPTPPPSGVQCFNQSLTQPGPTKKLDILFVIDTSGSLDDERASIANQINQFVGALPAETDYIIGVTLAHEKTSTSGKLWRDNNNHPLVLTKAQGIATIQSQLLSRITNQANNSAYDDANASGGEAGLISLKNMFSTNLAATKSAGFLRDDAGLAIVILSDENDLCVPTPQRSAVSGSDDANNNLIPDYEETFYQDKCSGISPANTYNTIVSARNGKPFMLSGILHLFNNQIPVNANNQDGVGEGYIQLIDLAQNKVKINMDTQDIASGLSQIGATASTILDLISEYKILEPITVDPSTVHVIVDGQTLLNSQYSLANNTISFPNNAGQANSQIQINYCGVY